MSKANGLRERIHVGPFTPDLSEVFSNNRKWSQESVVEDPDFFTALKDVQTPEILWVGCADSRVVANQIMGLLPGEVFVQRNVGNQFMHTDMNCMSALEFSVTALGVKHVVLCGHYNCGAVKAALTLPSRSGGLTNCWISGIRDVRNRHVDELSQLDSTDAQLERLCELNVMSQVFNICTCPVVQNQWAEGQELHVHGVIYGLADGLLNRLIGPISSMEDLAAMGEDSFEWGEAKKGAELFKATEGGGDAPANGSQKAAASAASRRSTKTLSQTDVDDSLTGRLTKDLGTHKYYEDSMES